MLLPALLAAAPAEAQSFADFETIGRLEDRRSQPSELSVGAHSFAPSIVYKLFGVTTPHVFAATRLAWTDNYLLQDPTTPGVTLQRELYGELSAGIRLDTEFSDHRLELGYRATAIELINSGSGDTLAQEGTLRLDLYGNDIEAHADAGWRRDAYPQSIQLTGIIVLDTFYAQGYTEIRFGDFGVRLGGGAEWLDYQRRTLKNLDASSYGVDVQLYWRLKTKLRIVLEYNWEQWIYRRGDRGTLNDYHLHNVLAGVDGEITPKLTASLKVGGGFQDTEHGPNPDRRDLQSVIVRTSLRWSPFERTAIMLSYVRNISPSTSSNGLQNDEARVDLEQTIWEELSAQAGFGYTHSIVNPGDHLNRLEGDGSLRYAITEWISVVGYYRFSKLVSAFPNSDYTAHEVGVSIGFGL